jgi:hypothetical protein
MKILPFIHPFWQSIAFCTGIYNAFMAITRKGFTVTRHRNVGLIYYFMTCIGLAGGSVITGVLERRGIRIEMEIHLMIGMSIVVLFVIAGTLGFLMLTDPAKIVRHRSIHKWINLTSLVLFLLQGMYGYFYLLTL